MQLPISKTINLTLAKSHLWFSCRHRSETTRILFRRWQKKNCRKLDENLFPINLTSSNFSTLMRACELSDDLREPRFPPLTPICGTTWPVIMADGSDPEPDVIILRGWARLLEWVDAVRWWGDELVVVDLPPRVVSTAVMETDRWSTTQPQWTVLYKIK